MRIHQPLHPTQRPAHHRVRRLPTALAVLVLALAGLVASTTTAAAAGGNGGSASENRGERVDVIGVFHDWVNDPGAAANDLERQHGGRLTHVYGAALRGFSGSFPANAIQGLERDRRVDYVELDGVMTATATNAAQSVPTGIARIGASSGNGSDPEPNVDIAIIDTGIDLNHPDLNVFAGYDCTAGCVGGSVASGSARGDDDNGHGTHVSGTAAARDNGLGVIGVAPGARLTAVKVLDAGGSGSFSDVIAGVDTIVSLGYVEVANLSLGCFNCSVTSLDDALDNAVSKGITIAVAAGNDGGDAAKASPASNGSVITVSALWDTDGQPGGGNCRTIKGYGKPFPQCDDELAYFSNWGAPVDLVAPGYRIDSTVPGGGYSSSYSGTSMASPHVAGAAAKIIADGTASGPSNVQAALEAAGTTDDWTDTSGDGMKEPLLKVGAVAPPPPPAPTASFTSSCDGLTCTFTATSTGFDSSATHAWTFGDGGSDSGPEVTHTFGVAGGYTVVLTTDDGSATDTASATVTVSEPQAASDIVLSADLKAKGKMVQLSWTGSGDEVVEVLRDGARIASGVGNSFNDRPNPGDHTYQICYVNIDGCSNSVEVTTG